MSRRINVSNGRGGYSHHVKKQVALEMVRRGNAEWVLFNVSIRLLMQACGSPLKCGQEPVYEKAAILPKSPFFHGGLTRTEHSPAAFNRHKGARVGHQA